MSNSRLKVDAILACRMTSTRLYGKPYQYIDIEKKITIIEYLVQYLKRSGLIDDIILAIADSTGNELFEGLAIKNGWKYIFGDEKDMLGRMIKATDQFHTDILVQASTESPFLFYEGLDEAINSHITGSHDMTLIADLPEGAGFNIFKADSLRKSHKNGSEKHRSELVSSYIFDHQKDFSILQIKPEISLRRSEVRVTVDYPEDLIFCRQVFQALDGANNLIRIEDIVKFWDDNPELRKPLETIGIDWGHGRIWE